MRTTLTLDPDVAAALEKVVSGSGVSFKEAVNTALRKGLVAPTATPDRRRFVQRTWSGGEMVPWDQIKQLLLDEDIERYR